MIISQFRSVERLNGAFEKIFARRALVVLHENCDFIWPTADVVDVVILGGSPSLLLQKSLWNHQLKFRLWVTSSTHARVLIDIMGLPATSVGLIPRAMIRRKLGLRKKKLSTSRIETVVISSRFTKSKNIPLTLAVAAEIQRRTFPPVSVIICGVRLTGAEVKAGVNRFEWVEAPEIHPSHDLGPDWAKNMPPRSALLNLSTSYEEDFGLNTEQASAEGLALWLSSWAAHLDIEAPRVLIPAKYILSSRRSKANFATSAKAIARICVSEQPRRETVPPTRLPHVNAMRSDELTTTLSALSTETKSELKRLFQDKASKPSSRLRARIIHMMSGF